MEIFCATAILFLLFYVSIIIACIVGWIRLPSYSSSLKLFKTRASIIIAARNEEQNILKCLESIVKQDYPKELLDIIVVNDNSEDNTRSVVEKMAGLHPQIKLITLNKFDSPGKGKKNAISEGIKNS